MGDMHMVAASLGSWLVPGELLNLFINALSGSVLESELGQKWIYGAVYNSLK